MKYFSKFVYPEDSPYHEMKVILLMGAGADVPSPNIF